MQECGYTSTAVVSYRTGSKANASLSRSFSSKKFFNNQSDHRLSGDAATNPLEQAYFGVYVAGLLGVDSPAVACKVVIDYIVMLSEPRVLVSS